jgi:hypothetical protein
MNRITVGVSMVDRIALTNPWSLASGLRHVIEL